MPECCSLNIHYLSKRAFKSNLEDTLSTENNIERHSIRRRQTRQASNTATWLKTNATARCQQDIR